jgi:hypothetical protein
MIPPSLWLRLAGLLAIIAIPIGLYLLGQHDGRADERQAAEVVKAASLRRLIAQQADLAAQDREVLTADVGRRVHVITQFQIIDHEVSTYALTHRDAAPCLDPDGLRDWRAAARGDAAEIAAAQPGIDHGISGHVAGAGDGAGAGPAGQLLGDGEAVPHAAGAVSEPGRVGAEPKPHWGWQ